MHINLTATPPAGPSISNVQYRDIPAVYTYCTALHYTLVMDVPQYTMVKEGLHRVGYYLYHCESPKAAFF